MKKIDRQELLKQLESVLSGLSAREIIEQSSCFVFKDEKVMTFNDEVSCSQKCILDITGAVPAMPFVNILRKLEEPELKMEVNHNKLMIRGRNRRASINLENDILLPIDNVEEPKKWKGLPDNFINAIEFVESCASTNETNFTLCCVHIHPDYMETCDNIQAARYYVETKIKKSTLVRRDSLNHITNLDMVSYSETDSWIHFKNQSGLVLSCRRFFEKSPKLDDILKITKGIKVKLPKGLKEVIDKAEVFSSENVDENKLRITLSSGKFRVEGKGLSGRYIETKKSKYEGKTIIFEIAASLLAQIVDRYTACRVTRGRLGVEGKNFKYITSTTVIKEKKKK